LQRWCTGKLAVGLVMAAVGVTACYRSCWMTGSVTWQR
jgi:hypothetical protein